MNQAGIKSIIKKLYFFCLPTQRMRSRYITRHAYDFHHIGGGVSSGNQDIIQQIRI